MNYRNRKLLDIAHEAPCMFQIEGICTGDRDPCVPAHSNLQRHGRGFSFKSHDCFAPAACNACHAWYDVGSAEKSDKMEAVERAVERWILWLFVNGKIRVS